MDITQIRKDTPGVEHVLHFNNAGASLPVRSVLKAITSYLEEEALIGGYRMKEQSSSIFENLYERIARLINAKADEIAITGSASEAFNKILYGLAFKKGDVIITSEMEYGNNFINYLNLKKKKGVEIRLIRNLENGDFDLEALKNSIDEKVKLIAITHVPTGSGLVAPVVEIGKIARANNILYLVDACQSVGQLPFDVQEVGCDFASATSRKYLRGPRGLGFLYVNDRVLEQLEPFYLDMVTTEWKSEEHALLEKKTLMFEDWEKPFAFLAGFSEAINYLLQLGVHNTWARIQELADYTRDRLAAVPGVHLHDVASQKCGIITFTKPEVEMANIKKELEAQQINISLSMPSSSITYMQPVGLSGVARASVHYYNTKEEIDRLVDSIDRI